MDRPMSGVIDPSGRRSSMSRRSDNAADDESDFELSRRQLVGGSDDERVVAFGSSWFSIQKEIGWSSKRKWERRQLGTYIQMLRTLEVMCD